VNVGYLNMLQGMFNSLVTYPVGDMGNIDGIEPDLAVKWDSSSDNKIWTFYLRKGVKFHKGYGELTSEDVKFSYERQKEMPWGGEYKHIDKIETPDKYTVKFMLKHSDPFFLQKLVDYHGGHIVSKKAVEDLGKKFVTYPVGTGPFQAHSFSSGDKYVLVRHEEHWKGKPILEKIIYRFMRPIASRTIAIENGEIDMTEGPFQVEWTERLKKAGIIIDGIRIGQHEYLCFNMTRPPLEKKAVRKALAYAICKEGLDELWGVNHESYHSNIPPNLVGYIPDDQIPEKYIYNCDPQKAKKLLAEAGYPNGFEMTLITPEAQKLEAQVMRRMYERIGLRVNLEVFPWPVWLRKVLTLSEKYAQEKNWDVSVCYNNDSFGHSGAAHLTWPFLDSSGIRWIEYDPVYEKMWKDMARTVDEKTQDEKMRKMEQYIYDHAYAVFIYSPLNLYAVNKDVNFVPQKFLRLRLKETSVTDKHWSVR
ncbi:MAG: ABC transporter substrate-binding protein, partial [Spirochaetes bacterium]|nr:ABC transporter substrate-binding protein [Spirochaetota bacterium]